MHKLKIIIIFIFAIIIFLSVPVFFVGVYPLIENFITGTLGIKINPALSGGEVMAVFNDDLSDDKGTGTYTYPLAEVYRPYKNHLDLIKYIVKKPVHNTSWSDYKDFWAFEIVLGTLANPLNAPAGLSFPIINIYINIDGMNEGREDTFLPGANVSFDPKHPWHYFIKVHGWEKDGKFYNYKNEFLGNVLIDIIKNKEKENKLRITIPIENVPELISLSDKDTTYHYVLIGNFDPIESENFRAISLTGSKTTGGGNPAPLIAPRVYDYLAPAGESQYKILSGYDSVNKKFAVLKPVKVEMGAWLENRKSK
jgi:carbohydrate-binding DOMON domain-containing protein